MEYSDPRIVSRWIVKFMLCFAAIACPGLVIYQAAYSPWIHPHPTQTALRGDEFSVPNSVPHSEEVGLERVLKEASTKNRTVIIATLNEAWAAPDSILDLFLESFRIGDQTNSLLNNLVIVALDQKAYTRCLNAHNHCFALTTQGLNFSKEAYYMTPKYLKMMWRRTEFLFSVLQLGYNFIFTDADIMWFREPFRRLYKHGDFQIASDHFNGKPGDMKNWPNGGFIYVKSNNRTIAFYKFWLASRETYPGSNEQDVFNKIKFNGHVARIGLKIRFLDTAYFGGFCEPSKNLNQVCTMHANCCFGLDSKVMDLRIMLDDWRKFMSLPPSTKKSWSSSWSVPQKCSLKSFHPPPTEDSDKGGNH